MIRQLSGRYRLEDYQRNLTTDHQAGCTQIVTDISNNPKYTEAQKTKYREIDIAAHIDVPLLKNNQFVALLAVHQSTPHQWTQTEVNLVEETVQQTWEAIERSRAEAALRESEEKYRTLFESIDQGFFVNTFRLRIKQYDNGKIEWLMLSTSATMNRLLRRKFRRSFFD